MISYNPPKSDPRVHVFIYTWNKVESLKITLEHLARTDWNNWKLFVLNNGSTDGTLSYLHQIREAGMFPEMRIIDLPINIGAPAARNWLVHEPENRYADWWVFFDDDVMFEPDWLRKMMDSMEQYPDAGVVGAKIINADGPKTIQHSGGVLTRAKDWIDAVVLFTNVPDDGRFDNISRRDYVMGCINLYKREVFEKVGDFDIRYSPTQFDDIDHHLRMRLEGYDVIFNGLVEVRHMRNSGGTQNVNHIANRYKFANKFSEEEAQQILSRDALKDFVQHHPWIMEKRG